ncbi:Uncharacterised protein family (UPF0158) [Halobacillus dabanensis]|uniref:Uncharacterized protein family (UPF0158) n=1 Tax=Halobacillus dabanensis TaxID=240302 RepID=A0A1I3U148_HALDA|nr:UPF0158 family protein [Halobacillus dabanensis]SFJ76259.1 Uncharacterised protein family (UPF0158) [Halobacillus dabanensis]
MKVKLSTVAENIDMHESDYQMFFDKQSYKIVLLTEGALERAEDGEPYDHLPEWRQEERKQAEIIVDDCEGRFVVLPEKRDLEDYSIMEDFTFSIKDEKVKGKLLHAIRGRGAFRRFRSQVENSGLLEDWYRYRDSKHMEVAREWCEEEGIQFYEE